MDRRQQRRAFLNRLGGWVCLAGISVVAVAGSSAQTPNPLNQTEPTRPPETVPTPVGTATPWVQASPPALAAPVPPNLPKLSTGNVKADSTAPTPPKLPVPSAAPGVTPKPSVAPPATPNQKQAILPAAQNQNGQTPRPPEPTPNPAAEEVKAKMLRERQRELSQSPGLEQPPILPDERGTFDKNELAYNQLQPDEKRALNQQARARIREETIDAYLKSGLKLNEDQLEVFALRYRQERRVLERKIQEEANRQRERRVPQIIEQLKKEFGRLNNPSNLPKDTVLPEGSLPSPPPAAPGPAPEKASPASLQGASANEANSPKQRQPQN